MHGLILAQVIDAPLNAWNSLSTSTAGEIILLIILIGASLALLPRDQRGDVLQPIILLLLGGFLALLAFLFSSIGMQRVFRFMADLLLFAAVARTCFLIALAVLERALKWTPQRIYLDLTMIIIYLMVLVQVLHKSGFETSQLFASSAVLAGILGLAWQGTLTNIFAGVALHIHHPFGIGDWVQFDDKREHMGKVKEISWRATTVETLDRIEVSIPNSKLAEVPLSNFMRPYGYSRRSIYFVCAYDVPPGQVHSIVLKAIEGAAGVLETPTPTIVTFDFNERGIQYWLRYFITNLDIRDGIDGGVRDRIWYSLDRQGIAITPAVNHVELTQISAETRTIAHQERLKLNERILHNNPLFKGLPEKACATLVSGSHTRRYAPNEVIIRQGEPGHELFLISSGTVRVSMSEPGTHDMKVSELGAGNFFGEMSVLTGSVRRSTVTAATECHLLAIDKQAFASAFAESPEILETISEIVASRLRQLDALDKSPLQNQHDQAVSLLAKIRQYFGIE